MSTDGEKKQLSQVVEITPVQHMISSCTGAVLTSLMMTPFDVVKIRLQSQAKPSAFTNGHCFLYSNGLMDHLCPCESSQCQSPQWFKRPGRFNGTLDAMVKIVRYEGITSLWSGLPPTLVMAVPATVVYFTSYEHLKKMLDYREDNTSDHWKPMVAGSTARVWAACLISPIEMVRTKMQSKRISYSEIRQAVKDTVINNGVLSLWRGLGPTLLRDVPFSDDSICNLCFGEGNYKPWRCRMWLRRPICTEKNLPQSIYWTGYEALKRHILVTTGHSTLTFYESFGSGALAGSVAAVITLPFDVIKTRRQIELGEMLMGRLKEPTSTLKVIRKIYSTEGFRALYTGLPPRLLKVAPACAIMISSFEYFKHFFASYNNPQTFDSDD